MRNPLNPARLTGLVIVLALHGGALAALWQHRLLPAPAEAATLFVELVVPVPLRPVPLRPSETAKPPSPQARPESPKPLDPPKPAPLALATPAVTPDEPVVPVAPAAPPLPMPLPPTPAPQPQVVAQASAVVEPSPLPPPPPPPPRPTGPVRLGGELSLACPERSPPRYPPFAKRMGEQGRVELRVELDEGGAVAGVRVEKSSGSTRLDAAAVAAVKAWQCTPARRDGVAVRAVALQPFNFILEGT